MSRWQDAGVVLDSDDEEQPESITTLSSPLQQPASHFDLEEDDETQRNRRSSLDLQLEPDLEPPAASPTHQKGTVFDLSFLSSDSELSDLPEGFQSRSQSPARTLPSGQILIEQQDPRRDGSGQSSFSRLLSQPSQPGRNRNNESLQDFLSMQQAQLLSEAPRRIFRKRNDIQLHPYLLEQQQYLKQCHARGVKPVRLRLEDTRAGPPKEAELTQTQEQQPSQSSQSSEGLWRLDSSASESRGRAQRTLSSSSQPDVVPPLAYADDELPDVADMLRSRAGAKLQLGNKRRKINQSSSSGLSRQSRSHDQPVGQSVVNSGLDEPDGIFEFPESPRQDRVPDRLRFQVPRSLPPPLQTPATPSRPQIPDQSASEESEDDPIIITRSTGRRNMHRQQHRTSPEQVSPATSSEGSSESEENEILRVQRRIKGVLPASWLRLDLQAQTKQRRPSTSPHRDRGEMQHEQSKGVAKRVIRPQPRIYEANMVPSIAFDVDEDSDEASRNPPLASSPPKHATTPEKHQQHLAESIFLDDIEEDNTIDAMLPAQPRGARQSKQGVARDGKQQSKLTHEFGFERSHRQSSSKGARQRGPRTLLSTIQPKRRHRPPRFRPPRLSILDIEESDNDGSEEPQFVRLAKRAAKQRDDLGRVSPGFKLIRLQTAEDTEDAHVMLRRWNQGVIRPRAGPRQRPAKSGRRPALAAISQNIQQTPPYSADFYPAETQPEDLDVPMYHRPQTSAVAKNLRQARLDKKSIARARPVSDHVNTENPTASTLPTKVQKLPKRRVLAKQRAFRAAQLEAPALPSSLSHEDFTLARFLHQAQLQRDRARANEVAAYGSDEPLASTDRSSSNTREDRVAQQVHQIQTQARQKVVRRPRKRPGRQVDAAAKEFAQVLHPVLPAAVRQDIVEIDDEPPARGVGLYGLPPSGTVFTIGFDAVRLPQGKCFDEGTFIGSGELNACLQFKHRDLGLAQTACLIPSPDGQYMWSVWNERVAGELRSVVTRICLMIEGFNDRGSSEDSAVAVALLRKVVHYVATTLHFAHPGDCEMFVHCAMEQTDALSDACCIAASGTAANLQSSIRMLSLALKYMVWEVAQIAQQDNIDQLEHSINQSARSILTAWSKAAAECRTLSNKSAPNRTSNERTAESIVATCHLLQTFRIAGGDMWSLAGDTWLSSVQDSGDINALEGVWADLFSITPLLNCSSSGNVDDANPCRADWSIPKALITRVLSLYTSTMGQTASLNAYVRTLLVRCYHLLVYWRWDYPETILYAWFDFFATRKLGGLRLEDANGSMRSLENLGSNPDLEPASSDSTFQMFLKLLAKGMLSLRSSYSDRKIQGIVWRFVPAHGRTYPKESSLAQDDLNALRNHHDLLSVLYWASPAGHRPRLDLLRNLVDHSASHRETCRLSVRAWSNLVRYQSSTDEPEAALEPFIVWVRDILTQTIAQYRMAKSEAEAQQAAWKAQGDKHFTFEYVSRIVDKNQRQVLAALSETISGLQSAVAAAANEQSLTALIRDSSISSVLSLCSERSTSVNNVMIEVFALYQTYLRRWSDFKASKRPNTEADESQEYGEWPELDLDLDAPEMSLATVSGASPFTALKPLDLVAEPVQQHLSNIFGLPEAPNPASTEAAIETLVKVAKLKIEADERDWTAYLDPHGAHSWHHLTDTACARKYRPLFYALAVEYDGQRVVTDRDAPTVVGPYNEAIYTVWLTSLVEQDSKFGYQNRLTEVLLNKIGATEGTLLHNLPFWSRSATSARGVRAYSATYSITMQEIRDRRLSLLDTVFVNMRSELNNPLRQGDVHGMHKRLLRKVMTSMKANYLDMKQCELEQGKYVAFIHALLGLFIQHTTEICPVDGFFTDGLAFPLSAEDPTYIVAKLRSYGPKLGTSKSQKEFATFLHNLLRQAVSGGEETAAVFATRLHWVMSEGSVHPQSGTPSMVAVIVGGILPAYLTDCFRHGTSYVIMQTLLTVIIHVFRDVLTHVNLRKETVDGALGTLMFEFLDAATLSLQPLLADATILDGFGATRTLTLLIEAVEALSTAIDYLVRLRVLLPGVWSFVDLISLSCGHLLHQESDDPSRLAHLAQRIHGRAMCTNDRFKDLRQFTLRNVQQAVRDEEDHQQAYGASSERRLELRQAVNRLRSTMARLTSPNGRRKRHKVGFSGGLIMV